MPNNDVAGKITRAEVMRRHDARKLAQVMETIEREQVDCLPALDLYRFAAKGWREKWNEGVHNAWCPYCRSAARVGFRYGRPEKWILEEILNLDRPIWWRNAAEDYLENEAPFWLKALAKLRAKPQRQGILQAEPEPVRGRGGVDLQRRELGKFFDLKTDLGTVLYQETTNQGTPSYILVIDDADARRKDRTVIAGIATGTGHLLRDVPIAWDGEHRVGEVRFEEEEVRAIGGPKGLEPIPAAELPEPGSDESLEEEDMEPVD